MCSLICFLYYFFPFVLCSSLLLLLFPSFLTFGVLFSYFFLFSSLLLFSSILDLFCFFFHVILYSPSLLLLLSSTFSLHCLSILFGFCFFSPQFFSSSPILDYSAFPLYKFLLVRTFDQHSSGFQVLIFYLLHPVSFLSFIFLFLFLLFVFFRHFFNALSPPPSFFPT